MHRLLTLALLVAALLLAGCNPCSARVVDEYLDELDPILAEYDDAVLLANNTPRIALSPHIATMQSTRRQIQAARADLARARLPGRSVRPLRVRDHPYHHPDRH